MIVNDFRPKAVVSPQADIACVFRLINCQMPVFVAFLVRRCSVAARAVVVEAFEGSPDTGSLVVLARPFIIDLGHFVEHARACHRSDGVRIQLAMADSIHQCDGACQGESRACAFTALIADRAHIS